MKRSSLVFLSTQIPISRKPLWLSQQLVRSQLCCLYLKNKYNNNETTDSIGGLKDMFGALILILAVTHFLKAEEEKI